MDIAQVGSHHVVGWIDRANQVSASQALALLKFPLVRRILLVRLKVDTARGTAANLPRQVSGVTSWTSFGATQSRISHGSSWVSLHSLSFPSAASDSAIGGLSAVQRREFSGTASSPEKHYVLNPNGTSEDVAGRRG